MISKIFLVDLDHTLCIPNLDVKDLNQRYGKALPKIEMINKVNSLYEYGHTIKLYTARGMVSLNGDIDLIKNTLEDLTKNWLKEHNVKYHSLIFGKQHGHYFIDDTMLSFTDFLTKEINAF